MMKILVASNHPPLSLLIRRSLSRFKYEWFEVDNGLDAFQKIIGRKFDLILLEFELPRMNAIETLRRLRALENFKSPPVLVLTATENQREKIEAEHFSQTEVLSWPIAIRKFVGMVQQILHQGTRIACLGGGTGLFTLLSGLKTLSGLSLSSIVSMSDDGGSTGKLRDIFGILPPGDVRRSLVALSTAPDLLNELMQYRFEKGKGLKGHSFGNLFLTALSEMRGSMSQAVKSASDILNIQGQVIPVTETVNTLKAELENGSIIHGESRIDLFEANNPKLSRIKRLWQEPVTSANPDALEALHNSHFILLGPGDLFTSVISNLIVSGIAEAVVSSHAKKIYVCNIMTKPGETTRFKVSDHVREIVRYLQQDALDYVLCSATHFSKASLEKYARKGQVPVVEGHAKKIRSVTRAKILWEDVASDRELVRHDSLKLANVLKKIIEATKR